MKKKMKTIGIIRYILGYILGRYWSYIGIMENKMETTTKAFKTPATADLLLVQKLSLYVRLLLQLPRCLVYANINTGTHK